MKISNRKTLYSGLVIDLEQMEVEIGSKGWHTFEIVRHPGGVAVLPLHEDATVTLIRQFRPAIEAFTLEVPAGRLAPGEEPSACGLRELIEETGIQADNIKSLGYIYPSPGVFDEKIHLYLATGLTQGIAEPEQDEDIETVRIPLQEALKMAQDGTISDGKTIAALMRSIEIAK